MKLSTLLFLLLLSLNLDAQFQTLLNDTDTKCFEIDAVDCANTGFGHYAKIKKGYNGNASFDALEFGSYDLNTGVVLPTEFQYTSSTSAQFIIADNIEMLSLTDPISGQCIGQLIAISIRTAASGTFGVHFILIDPSGSILFDYDHFDLNGASEYCNELYQDSNGDIVALCTTDLLGRSQMMTFKMNLLGLPFGNCRIHRFDANTDGIDDIGQWNDITEVFIPSSNAAYAVTGTIGKYAATALLDGNMTIVDHVIWDIDGATNSQTESIAIENQGNSLWIAGNFNEADGQGNTPSRTYLLSLNIDPALGGVLQRNWNYGFSLPFTSNYVTDMEIGTDASSVVLAGAAGVSYNNFFSSLSTSYLLEVDASGSIQWAYDHSFPLNEGVTLDLEKTSTGYIASGASWDNSFAPVFTPHMYSALQDGSGDPDCMTPLGGSTDLLNELYITTPTFAFDHFFLGSGYATTLDPVGVTQVQCGTPSVCQNAPATCSTDQLVINTGYDPLTGLGLPASTGVPSSGLSSQDPNWILTNAPTNNGPVSLNSPAFVILQNGSWDANSPTVTSAPSMYISAFPTSAANAANISTALDPYVYERKFCVCDDNIDVTFDLYTHVDNQVILTLQGPGLTTPVTLINLSATVTANFENPPETLGPVTVTLDQGTYTLVAEHRNDNTGSPMGLNINGTVSTSSPSLLEVTCCNSGSFISGYKFIDVNCNGSLQPGVDLPTPGWTIQLEDQFGTVLQTAVTDVRGYYSFNVTTSGTYVVRELPQSGFEQNFPPGNLPHTITVSNPEIIANINFENCYCTDIVGISGPVDLTEYSRDLFIWDMVEFNGELIALDYSSMSLFSWDKTLDAWAPTPVYGPSASLIHDIETHNGRLYLAGANPGYLDNTFAFTPLIPGILPASSEISDFEVMNGRLFAGGVFPAPISGNLIEIFPSVVSASLYNGGDVLQLGASISQPVDKLVLLGNIPNNIGLHDPSGPTNNFTPLGSGLTFSAFGSSPDFDIVEYNGQIHVAGPLSGATGVTGNQRGHAVYDYASSSWQANTGVGSSVEQVTDMAVEGGLLFIVGKFTSLGPNTLINGAILDGTTYRPLGRMSSPPSNQLLQEIIYLPSFKNGSDYIALGGEAPFFLGTCGENTCYSEFLPPNGCSGQALQFNSITSPAGSCTWDFGDGSPLVSGCTPLHTYASPGTYTVTLYFDNLTGCETSDVQQVIINTGLDPNFSTSFSGNVLSTTPVSSGGSRTWSWGDGSPNTPGASPQHTYAAAGSYIVCQQVDNNGCLTSRCQPTVQLPANCAPCAETVTWDATTITSGLAGVSTNGYMDLTSYNGTLVVSETGQPKRWNGSTWTPMDPTFTANAIENFVVHQGTLWATANLQQGFFQLTDLIYWDDISSRWIRTYQNFTSTSFPTNNNYGQATELASTPTGLAVGGTFDAINSLSAQNIALFDPTTSSWSTLGAGTNGQVTALDVIGSRLYMGGRFTLPYSQVSYWDGAAWQAMSGGVQPEPSNNANSGPKIFYDWNGTVVVGGVFPAALNSSSSPVAGTRGIVAYDPLSNTWASIGGGISSTFFLHGVNSVKEFNNDLYVGGFFSQIGGLSVVGIATWDGTTYSSTSVSNNLEVEDIVCHTDQNGDCELWVGGEQVLARFVCSSLTVCSGDLNDDRSVDILDFILFNSAFGSTCPNGCPEDFDGSGTVDVGDFLVFNSFYGSTCDGVSPDGTSALLSVHEEILNYIHEAEKEVNEDLRTKILSLDRGVDFLIIPNPSDGRTFDLRLDAHLLSENSLALTIYDSSGKRVYSTTVTPAAELAIALDSQLTSGLYHLTMSTTKTTYSKQLVVH